LTRLEILFMLFTVYRGPRSSRYATPTVRRFDLLALDVARVLPFFNTTPVLAVGIIAMMMAEFRRRRRGIVSASIFVTVTPSQFPAVY